MPYRFSARSEAKLHGVHPDLIKVVRRALELSPVDFGITEGLRTEARQKELVEAGASRTMKSRHLTGHAIDVVAYVGGTVRWDGPLFSSIAKSFQQASIELGIPVVWGGSWALLDSVEDVGEAVMDYVARCKREGKKPLIDGPHFELARQRYPT
jgi:peptidoglycan L-alanyl-D-glutamate endopeptidase CwlK